MHGSVFTEFRQWVTDRHSENDWSSLLSKAGLEDRYRPLEIYPDGEFAALLGAAEERFQADRSAILYDFGNFIAPSLVKMYWGAVRPEWKALDLIEHTDDTIHSIVRLQNAEAMPPYLEARRIDPDRVLIIYTSPRRLCALAKGIALGVGRFYDEQLEIREESCMHRGDADCRFVVGTAGKL